jgi:membrane protease YdiL (CAAX protease family)
MQKLINACREFYYSSPNFVIRLLKLIVLSSIPIALWGMLTELIFKDLLQIEIPDVYDLLKKGNIPMEFSYFFVILLGPIIETLFFQHWIFLICKWIGKKLQFEISYGFEQNAKWATILSSVLFAVSHYDNHYLYPIIVFPMGLFLGWIYLSNLTEFKNKSRAFWMTACFHMFNNGMATILYIVENT